MKCMYPCNERLSFLLIQAECIRVVLHNSIPLVFWDTLVCADITPVHSMSNPRPVIKFELQGRKDVEQVIVDRICVPVLLISKHIFAAEIITEWQWPFFVTPESPCFNLQVVV